MHTGDLVRWLFWGAVAGATIASSALIPRAHADPTDDYTQTSALIVCQILDQHPTIPGIAGVIEGIQTDSGFTVSESARVLVDAIYRQCPRHLPLLQRFIDTYGEAA